MKNEVKDVAVHAAKEVPLKNMMVSWGVLMSPALFTIINSSHVEAKQTLTLTLDVHKSPATVVSFLETLSEKSLHMDQWGEELQLTQLEKDILFEIISEKLKESHQYKFNEKGLLNLKGQSIIEVLYEEGRLKVELSSEGRVCDIIRPN